MKETTERTAAISFTEINARRRGPIRRYFLCHPRVMDLLVVAGFLLGTLPNALISAFGQEQWWTLPVVFAVAAALMLRRSKPLLLLIIISLMEPLMILFSEAMVGVGVGIWICLYAVAVSHSVKVSFTALGLSAIPSIGGLWLAPERVFDNQSWAALVLIGFILLTYFIAVGIGVTVRRDRRHEEVLALWAERHGKLASASERNRIAREMHDVVAHSLSVMIALSDGAGVLLRRGPEGVDGVLRELSSTGRTALADMRRVLGVLREGESNGAPREPQPVNGSLASLLEGFRVAGLPLKTVISGPALPLHQAFALSVYRIVQESLTNVLRYAKGIGSVEVRIERLGAEVRIRITDDGASPFDEPRSVGSGQGITGMKERAAIYRGHLSAGPLPRGGWQVDVLMRVPGEGE